MGEDLVQECRVPVGAGTAEDVMSSIQSGQGSKPTPGPQKRSGDAAPSTAGESGGAPATEEDIGTEGAGTEPPAEGTTDGRRDSPSK